MTTYKCRFYSRKYPEEGEMVVGKVVSVDTEGVRVNLIEYGDAYGLILLGELSKKRIKNVSQITKVGNVEVCIVLRVDNERGYIDLSLAKVNDAEREECQKNFLKNKIGYNIMTKAAKKLNKDVVELYNIFGYKKEEEFGSLYYFFARVKEDESILENNEFGLAIKKLIRDEFQASTFKVRADIEVTCAAKDGVEIIKRAFKKAIENDQKMKISLLNTPTYSVVRVSSDKNRAYKAVEVACDFIKQHVLERGGTVYVTGKPKLFGEKNKYAMLAINDESQDESSS